jgi:hypothetical protein
MVAIDASALNVALPTIGDDLGLGLSGQQWIFLSYSLVLASLYLVAGALGDRFGQRRAFMAGAAAFALASALAGAAPSGAALIAARALQGVARAASDEQSRASPFYLRPRERSGRWSLRNLDRNRARRRATSRRSARRTRLVEAHLLRQSSHRRCDRSHCAQRCRGAGARACGSWLRLRRGFADHGRFGRPHVRSCRGTCARFLLGRVGDCARHALPAFVVFEARARTPMLRQGGGAGGQSRSSPPGPASGPRSGSHWSVATSTASNASSACSGSTRTES